MRRLVYRFWVGKPSKLTPSQACFATHPNSRALLWLPQNRKGVVACYPESRKIPWRQIKCQEQKWKSENVTTKCAKVYFVAFRTFGALPFWPFTLWDASFFIPSQVHSDNRMTMPQTGWYFNSFLFVPSTKDSCTSFWKSKGISIS